MAKNNTTEKKPRAPRQVSPEIQAAKEQCLQLRMEAEVKCSEAMASARQAAKVRKLTEGMTPEQREALKKSLETT